MSDLTAAVLMLTDLMYMTAMCIMAVALLPHEQVNQISDTLIDLIKLLPFLFLTYLAMEYLEHRAGEKAEALMRKAGPLGPVIGGALGIVPQCGPA